MIANIPQSGRPLRVVPKGLAGADGADGNDAVAAQQRQFDATAAEDAELQRELAALDDMLMAQVKNDDEILKKWIAMI